MQFNGTSIRIVMRMPLLYGSITWPTDYSDKTNFVDYQYTLEQRTKSYPSRVSVYGEKQDPD